MRYELKIGVLTAAIALALGLTACGGGDKKRMVKRQVA